MERERRERSMSTKERDYGPRNYVMAKANRLVSIIREAQRISFGELCEKGHLAPSTLYNYRKIILAKFSDIEYRGDEFRVKPMRTALMVPEEK
jgi:hypothetical protein